MNTERENETKFLLCAGRKGKVLSGAASSLLFFSAVESIGDHLMVYYDDGDDGLLNEDHTFRLTLRNVNGVNKHRATLKIHRNSTDSVRTCDEYHFPLNEYLSPLRSELFLAEQPQEMEDLFKLEGFPYYLTRTCWLRVKRHRLIVNGVHCELDICKTNNGTYFEELETKEPVTKEWINHLKNYYGVTWLSNTNKYKRTRLLNEM